MSGVYGIWKPNDNGKCRTINIDKLRLWNRAYGSSGEQLYRGGNISLGCFLENLSERKESGTSVIKRNQKYAVIDALLYNHKELCEKAMIRETCSDEEVLFHFIDKFGMEGLKEVNGDFCGAIYDMDQKSLTLFRDHLGVRPLFYYSDQKSVCFSTDIRGLLGTEEVDSKIDERWLWGNLVGTGFFGTENTEFAHVFCVKPASYLTFSLKGNEIHKEKTSYWELGRKKVRRKSEQFYIEEMRNLITDAVKRRLDTVSGEVGAELSGGLDSGVIDILIHRFGRECAFFSWSASPEDIPFAQGDERLVIEDICKQEGITCNYGGRTIVFNENSILTEKTRQLGLEVDLGQGPFRAYALPPYVGTLPIAEAAQFMKRRGVNTIFSGHGGDEGVSHRCNPYELLYHKEYISYFKHIWPSTEGRRFRVARTLKRCYQSAVREKKRFSAAYEDVYKAKEIIKQEFYEKYAQEKQPSLKFAFDAKGFIEQGGSRNRLDVVALLGGYSGVRYLMPYLDYRVIDYAVSIPRRMYLRRGKTRYIFREAFKDIMPQSLYTCEEKESNSWNNLEKKEQKESDYLEQKKWYASLLDREYWDPYFDWDALDQWAEQERKEETKIRDKGIFRNISLCVLVQNLVERSKQVCEVEE